MPYSVFCSAISAFQNKFHGHGTHFKIACPLVPICLWPRVAGICFLLLGLSGCFRGEKKSEEPLVIAEESLLLGDLWCTNKHKTTISIHNRSSSLVSVSGIEASCDCLSLNPRVFEIKPEETKNIEVTIDITRPEEFRVNLVVFYKSAVAKAIRHKFVTITGTSHAIPVRIIPVMLEFRDDLLIGGPFDSVSAELEFLDPVEDIALEYDNDYGVAKLQPSAKGPARYVLEFTPAPTLPAGPFATEVLIKTTFKKLGDVPKNCAVSILPIQGKVVTNVSLTPDDLFLGTIKVGEELSRTVVLSSKTKRAFMVESISVSDKKVVAVRPEDSTRTSHLPNERQEFVIDLVARKLGFDNVEIRFLVQEDQSKSSYQVLLPIQYYGL